MKTSKIQFCFFLTFTLFLVACSNQNPNSEPKVEADTASEAGVRNDNDDTLSIKENNNCYQLSGSIQSSAQSGSGWMDLTNTTDFKSGDTLQVLISGTARSILVRLLPKGADPGSPIGVLGGPKAVPPGKLIIVVLNSTHPNVTQVSVHGNPKPFNIALGANNGAAELVSVALCRSKIK